MATLLRAMIVLYDTPAARLNLYPFSLTRPLADLYMGCGSLRAWWQSLSPMPVGALTEAYLHCAALPTLALYYCIDASILPNAALLKQVLALQANQQLIDDEGIVAYCSNHLPQYGALPEPTNAAATVHSQRLRHASQLFLKNELALRQQMAGYTGHIDAPVDRTNQIICPENVQVGAGARLTACIINASNGPVHIGKNAVVMEGALLHGPISIGEGAVVKMGAKLYPGTSIGAYCVAGGEIKNSILMPFSNKAHDGYLGDSVVGSWCNLGAGTSNSNVKNTAGLVSMWHQGLQADVTVGQKAGLLMGDYSRTAIHTAFNTGTTVGVCCNVFGHQPTPNHLPSFSWGTVPYVFVKALEHINNWMRLKNQALQPEAAMVLQHIFDQISSPTNTQRPLKK